MKPVTEPKTSSGTKSCEKDIILTIRPLYPAPHAVVSKIIGIYPKYSMNNPIDASVSITALNTRLIFLLTLSLMKAIGSKNANSPNPFIDAIILASDLLSPRPYRR